MTRAPLHSIDQIVAMLRAQAENLARDLLPGGKREGREWVCGGLDGRAGRGLSVCIAGSKQGVWGEFAAGQAGDMLDLIAQARTGGDKGEALKWARNWLGLGSVVVQEVAPRAAPPLPARDHEADTARRVQSGIRSFAQALPWPGTPVEHYLAARAIPRAQLAHQPSALRYHPEMPWSRDEPPAPAMLGCITRGSAMIGLHVTWLERVPAGSAAGARGGEQIWRRRPGKAGKRMLGRQQGGIIPLARGASGVPLAKAPDGDTLALTEGIEDALSVAIEMPHWRVAAALSCGNLQHIDLPEAIGTVVLCLQRDGENPAVRRGIEAAIDRFTREGRTVRAVQPPEGIKDWNDWRRQLAEQSQQRNVG